MKMFSKFAVVLSVVAFALAGCGNTEADDAALDGTEGAPESSESAEGEEVAQTEQSLDVGRYTSCKSNARPVAGCSRGTAFYGCESSVASSRWIRTRVCVGCVDRGSYVTCWF